jgi:hypothetical protein
VLFHFEPGPDRWKLGFKEEVVASFKFLRKYGFRRVRAEATLVRYHTAWPLTRNKMKLFVNVYHGRGSYEMGVEMGPRERESEAVTLPEIVEWAGGEESKSSREHVTFQTSSREGVQKFVPKLAELVKKYAGPFLRGDAKAYDSLLGQRHRSTQRYLTQMELDRAREKAEAAWHAKDYAQVVRFYEPFQDELKRSEAAKLKYAKKQMLQPAR